MLKVQFPSPSGVEFSAHPDPPAEIASLRSVLASFKIIFSVFFFFLGPFSVGVNVPRNLSTEGHRVPQFFSRYFEAWEKEGGTPKTFKETKTQTLREKRGRKTQEILWEYRTGNVCARLYVCVGFCLCVFVSLFVVLFVCLLVCWLVRLFVGFVVV